MAGMKRELEHSINEQTIITYLKQHKDELLTSAAIAEGIAGRTEKILTPNTVKKYMSDLARSDKYPNIEGVKRKGYIYHSKRYNAPKNNEGYMDLTASKAIESADPEPSKPSPSIYQQGSIYSYLTQKGETEYFLILNQFDDHVIGIPVFKKELVDKQVNIPFVVSSGNTDFKGDASEIRTKPSKYLGSLQGICTNQDLELARFMVINEGLDCEHLIERARSIHVDGADYTEQDIDGMIDRIEDLNAINAVLKKENESKDNKIESIKKANEHLVMELEDEKDRCAKLKDELEELKAKSAAPAAPAAVEHILACDVYWTKDTITELVTSLNIYREFFDAYCTGLKKGV